MEEIIKIVFTGTVGSGKTQAIKLLSDIPVVSTDVDATDEVRKIKEKTTVAMDYGEVALDANTTLALFGTPGQERFRFMWEILSEGALGFIIMVDDSRDDPVSDLDSYLNDFKKHIELSCAVIGITHTDVSDSPNMKKYYEYLSDKELYFPIFKIDARRRSDVLLLIEAMMAVLEVA